MKRKKWSEVEEETLLSKYWNLQKTGTLNKLKTREKKYKPIAEHVNSLHHLIDPIKFPFRWSWRDVSIKVQNMRHQYINVKHKIRLNDVEFNWEDGVHHWENFGLYKDVFGDVEIEPKKSGNLLGDEFFDVGFEELDQSEEESEENEGSGAALVGAQVMELRDVVMRREEKKREREFRAESQREEEGEVREMVRARRESQRMVKLEMEFDEERKRRMKVEKKWEEEEMKWREKMVSMQIEHEKQMMQLHANACQNQMQLLGVMARFFCQFFGSANDGLGSLVAPQVLQNLQHTIPGGLDDNGKPDANSPSEFL